MGIFSAFFERLIDRAADNAVGAVGDQLKAGRFDQHIEEIIVKTVREGRDDGLSRIGFILKITVELIDKSTPPLPYKQARDMAEHVWQQFRRDNEMVKFGTPGWDWSGAGARDLAREYEIELWEPQP